MCVSDLCSCGEEPLRSVEVDLLVARVSALIDNARDSIASYANAILTMTYWQIESIIDSEVLREERAEYGAQTLVTLARELTGSSLTQSSSWLPPVSTGILSAGKNSATT